MSCSCFSPSVVQPSVASQDPGKHVAYQLGMVLGVDDLNQEFAYHAERLRWTTRDLLGYGTAWGLRVTTRDDGPPAGPQVVVSSGVAISPRGQLIRVAPMQCASLNDWLAAHPDDVQARKVSTPAPNVFNLPLYVVASYRECLTDLVPIAGEPCRSEGDSTKPSRVTDDFLLELVFDPPPQQEEDAVREFVQWMRAHIAVVNGALPSMTIAELLDAIRAAAAAPALSPPGPGSVLAETSPPTLLTLAPGDLDGYLRAALRLWVTELRPSWRPSWLGDRRGCAGGTLAAPDQGNQVLLAALTVPIVPPGLGSSAFTVTSAADVVITEDARPLLLHMRLLQEMIVSSLANGGSGGGTFVAAAGVVNADGTDSGRATVNNLRVVPESPPVPSEVKLAFDGYFAPPPSGGPQYVVKTTPWPSGPPLKNLTVTFGGFDPDGFRLEVSTDGAPLNAAQRGALQLMVEVTAYP